MINKVRMLNGWTTKTAQELDATIRTWAEVFDKHRIPIDAYNELYLQAFNTRSRKLFEGKDIELDATLMVASWPAVSAAREQKRIEDRRYISSIAASQCQRCYGAGMEVVPGRGARVCNHEPINAE